jgi:hypothetical protein
LAIGKRYNAVLAWVAIQVIPELQTFNAYFGTIGQIQERKERFSIPMKPDEIRDHGYERLGDEDEFDPSIRPEWSNGGYPAHLTLARGRPVMSMEKARAVGIEESMRKSPVAEWKQNVAERDRQIVHLQEQLAAAKNRET